MTINLKQKSLFYFLLLLIALLLMGNLVGQYLLVNYNFNQSKWPQIIFMAFDFNTEANFPTFFSSLLLFANALFLLIISKNKQVRFSRFWLVLSIIFFFLSFDEILTIHERLIVPIRSLFGTSGYLYFAWVIPYVVGMLILGIYSYRFLFYYLPVKTRNQFILSGFIFVTGAVGMELIGGNHAEIHGEGTSTYFLIYTLEEFLEMLGSSLFFYALLDYIYLTMKRVQVVLRGNSI